ncbi:MAG: DUF4112 domain-containing protein [Balneolales bacterium]|nr:DUF4112 domain-containing protein [Balneolales bacterium]
MAQADGNTSPEKNKPRINSTKPEAELRQILERLDTFSYYTDSNIRVPFTKFRFGLSPLLGLLPGVGDFAGLILSLYVLWEARRAGASGRVKRRMIRNMLIEFVFGLMPVIGDAFDAAFKANTRNTALLRRYLLEQLDEAPKERFPWLAFGVFIVVFALLGWVVWRVFG